MLISAPTWNDIFELPDRSYSVSDIQNYFLSILTQPWKTDWLSAAANIFRQNWKQNYI